MASSTDPNFGLEHSWALRENLWKDGMDANLKKIGAMAMLEVLSATTTAQPASPTSGDRYLLPTGCTGTDWAGNDGDIAVYLVDTWNLYTPGDGWECYVYDTKLKYRYTDSAWAIAYTLDDAARSNNSLSRKIDFSSGHATGVKAAALKDDAINRLALQRATMPFPSVISEVATLPTSPNPGDRHLLSSAATTHAGEIAQAVPNVLDYTTWTTQDTTVDNAFTRVIRIEELGLWVGISSTGTGNRVVTSPSGLTGTWTPQASASDSAWYDICWASGIGKGLVCVVGNGGAVMTSPDAVTWTSQTASNTDDYRGVCWGPGIGTGNGRLVAVAASGSGSRGMYSDNGEDWFDCTGIEANIWNGIDFSSEQSSFVACASSGTYRMMKSSNGSSFSPITASATNTGSWNDIVWASGIGSGVGLWCSVSSLTTDDNVLTSPDGDNWTLGGTGTNGGFRSVCYAKELPLLCMSAITSGGVKIWTSHDGSTWTGESTPENLLYYSVAWAGDLGRFCAMSSDGTANRALLSAVDTRWMYEPPQNGNSVYVQSLDAYYEHIENTWIQPTNRPVLTDYGKANMRAVYVAETNTTDTGTDSASMTMVTGNAEFLEAFDLNKAYLLDVELMCTMLDTSYTAATTIWHGKALRFPFTGDSPTFTSFLTNNDGGYGATVFNVDPVFVWGSSGLEITVEHTGEASRTYDAAWQLSVRLQYLDDGEPVC